jgi:uncharacterized protein YecE (DUF72 family)
MSVYVGTCGWSYPQGAGKWDGLFYPTGLADRDKLVYYAERFAAVEVNSSFYRPLLPQVARAWVNRTPPAFRFCIKLFNKFTHPKMFEEAAHQDATVTDQDYTTARDGLEPLAASGRLGALLAQFPPSFKADDRAVAYLEQLIRQFQAYPLALELRHRSWNERADLPGLLQEYGVAWAMIDEPKFKTSIREVPLTSRLGYFRFHGRNYAQWWKGDRESRYDYLYPPAEQQQLAEEVRQAAEQTADTFVFYNNHYRAKAVVNALELERVLGQPTAGDLTEAMLEEYPQLREIVGVSATEPAPSDDPA